jgi:hypothetical protein
MVSGSKLEADPRAAREERIPWSFVTSFESSPAICSVSVSDVKYPQQEMKYLRADKGRNETSWVDSNDRFE